MLPDYPNIFADPTNVKIKVETHLDTFEPILVESHLYKTQILGYGISMPSDWLNVSICSG